MGGASDGTSNRNERIFSQPATANRNEERTASDAASLASAAARVQKRLIPMVRRRLVRIALALVFVSLLAGCKRLERAGECRSISKLVNPTLEDIDDERKTKPQEARTYESIAARYMLLSGALAQQKVEYKKLQEPLAEYQRLLQEASRDSRQYAEALSAKDDIKRVSARAAAARTVKKEAALVGKIDAACRQK